MALFGGNKKVCPICGNPAAKLLATKVEGEPLCKECDSKVAILPSSTRTSCLASVAAFKAYLDDYNGNQTLRDSFRESYRHQFGILGGNIILDASHRLLRLDASENAFVLEPQNIRSFRILEDGSPLFEGTKDGLICYQSSIPDQVRNLGPDIDRLQRDQMHHEEMERMEEMLEKQANQNGETYSRRYIPAPDINQLRPFEKFYVLIDVDHPYSNSNVEFKVDAPYFSGPDFFGGYSSAIKDYLRDYEVKAREMRELATQLMSVLNPGAPERQVSSGMGAGMWTQPQVLVQPQAQPQVQPQPAAPAEDPVAAIQKYKGLLDSGVITEEEFAAKKRQLMGL